MYCKTFLAGISKWRYLRKNTIRQNRRPRNSALEFSYTIMYQSLYPRPLGPGNSGTLNFSIFKGPAKSPALRGQICGKSLLNAPLPGLTIMNNNR